MASTGLQADEPALTDSISRPRAGGRCAGGHVERGFDDGTSSSIADDLSNVGPPRSLDEETQAEPPRRSSSIPPAARRPGRGSGQFDEVVGADAVIPGFLSDASTAAASGAGGGSLRMTATIPQWRSLRSCAAGVAHGEVWRSHSPS